MSRLFDTIYLYQVHSSLDGGLLESIRTMIKPLFGVYIFMWRLPSKNSDQRSLIRAYLEQNLTRTCTSVNSYCWRRL